MEFLGIGPEELIFILVILFLILGPKDLVKLGSALGRTLRTIRESGVWKSINDATRQLRELPQTLARQAGVEELKKMGKEIGSDLNEPRRQIEELDRQFVAWTRQPDPSSQNRPRPLEPKETNDEK
jgi:sec-independent protein translocase protein TatA